MKKKEVSYITRKIFSKKRIEKIEKKIKMLSSKNRITINFFLNFQLISSIIVFFIVLYNTELGILIAPFITIIYFLLIDYLLIENSLKLRATNLEVEALYFFEIFSLCLESGSSFEIALKDTTDNINSELSKEFKKALTEIKYGKTINESLENMKDKIPSSTIKNILTNIIEANKLGTSILDTLYNQIDYLQNKRIMSIKEQISKIPIKISIISVLLFIPIILLIILSPIVIDIIT